jgi:hypothetical protein
MKKSLTFLLCLFGIILSSNNNQCIGTPGIAFYSNTSGFNTVFHDTNDSIKKSVQPRISIDPNPVETQAEISMKGIELDNLHYLLINELGQKVRIREIDSNPFIFDRTGLQEGVYIFSILDEKNQVLAKDRVILK